MVDKKLLWRRKRRRNVLMSWINMLKRCTSKQKKNGVSTSSRNKNSSRKTVLDKRIILKDPDESITKMKIKKGLNWIFTFDKTIISFVLLESSFDFSRFWYLNFVFKLILILIWIWFKILTQWFLSVAFEKSKF